MTKLIALSDTHGQSIDIKPCDILVHCGDVSPLNDHSFYYQQQWMYDSFIPELAALPAKHVVWIAGNHDYFLAELCKSKAEWKLREALPLHIHYLRDSEVTIEGLRIYGTPWIPVLEDWAFYYPDNDGQKTFEGIPSGLDILLSHGPMHSCGDRIEQYNDRRHLGSKPLRDRVFKAQPRYMFHGHIHSGRHSGEQSKLDHPTKSFNVSVSDEDYKKAYEPFEMEL